MQTFLKVVIFPQTSVVSQESGHLREKYVFVWIVSSPCRWYNQQMSVCWIWRSDLVPEGTGHLVPWQKVGESSMMLIYARYLLFSVSVIVRFTRDTVDQAG